VLWILTLITALILYWIYDGYGRCLQVLTAVKTRAGGRSSSSATVPHSSESQDWPTVTVLLTVYNEAAVIRRRLENILACEYPADRLRILVASDGSTDETNAIVLAMNDDRIQLYESPGLGKTGTQNAAIRSIQSEIIAFTDADILFEPSWLKQVARRFQDSQVGAVDGRAIYQTPASDALQASQGFYWNYELKLRLLESQLGILAVVAGACFAIRREIFIPMDPAIGEDCIIPLDVVTQGLLVVHEPQAVAWFEIPEDSSITLRRRIRMTLRNWQGTWTRSPLLNPLRHPGYAFALWSHKLLRWLSPVFLTVATVCSASQLLLRPGLPSLLLFLPFGLLFVLAGLGRISTRYQIRIPGAGTAYSFVLANAAFLIGIWRAITGHRIHSYRNT